MYDIYCRKALGQGRAYEPCQIRKEAARSLMCFVLYVDMQLTQGTGNCQSLFLDSKYHYIVESCTGGGNIAPSRLFLLYEVKISLLSRE